MADVIDALKEMHTALVNTMVSYTYMDDGPLSGFMNNQNQFGKSLFKTIAGKKFVYETAFPKDNNGNTWTKQLFTQVEWRPEFKKRMNYIWGKVMSLWSASVPGRGDEKAKHFLEFSKRSIEDTQISIGKYQIVNWIDTLEKMAKKGKGLYQEVAKALQKELNPKTIPN